MAVKFVTKNGARLHGPPYSIEEEKDFYRGSIVSVFRGQPTSQEQQSLEPPQPQKAKRHSSAKKEKNNE
jgi:hypothetical protein